MQRNVMKDREDAVFPQIPDQLLPLLYVLCLDVKHMRIMHAPLRNDRKRDPPFPGKGSKHLIILIPPCKPRLIDLIRALQLRIQIGGVKLARKIR